MTSVSEEAMAARSARKCSDRVDLIPDRV
jgi:hypothetical protein